MVWIEERKQGRYQMHKQWSERKVEVEGMREKAKRNWQGQSQQ